MKEPKSEFLYLHTCIRFFFFLLLYVVIFINMVSVSVMLLGSAEQVNTS